MALEYVVTKRVFGFDDTKSVKYVPKSVTSGSVEFEKLCEKVARLCGVHRKIVDLVITGATDEMADMLDDGKSVRLGDFGLFRPPITGKSADNEEDVTASNIVRRRIVFTPGKIFQSTLDNMSVTRAVTPDIDWTDKSSSTGSNSGSSNNSGNTEGGDDELDPLG